MGLNKHWMGLDDGMGIKQKIAVVSESKSKWFISNKLTKKRVIFIFEYEYK